MSNKTVRNTLGLCLLIAIVVALIFYPKILRPPQPVVLEMLKLAAGYILLFLCACCCLFRLVRGPHAADRIMAFHVLGMLIVGACALLSINTKQSWYMDIGIVWALQSFITTLIFTKFLEGKGLDE